MTHKTMHILCYQVINYVSIHLESKPIVLESLLHTILYRRFHEVHSSGQRFYLSVKLLKQDTTLTQDTSEIGCYNHYKQGNEFMLLFELAIFCFWDQAEFSCIPVSKQNGNVKHDLIKLCIKQFDLNSSKLNFEFIKKQKSKILVFQPGISTTIRRTCFREAGAPRHHGGQLRTT